jgi:hypothetical protein
MRLRFSNLALRGIELVDGAHCLDRGVERSVLPRPAPRCTRPSIAAVRCRRLLQASAPLGANDAIRPSSKPTGRARHVRRLARSRVRTSWRSLVIIRHRRSDRHHPRGANNAKESWCCSKAVAPRCHDPSLAPRRLQFDSSMAAVEQSSLPQRHDGHHLAGAFVELHTEDTEAFSQSLSSCLTASCVESPKQLAASDPRPRRARCCGKTGRRGRCHRSTRAARRGVQLEPDRLNVTVMVAAAYKHRGR